MILVRSIQSSRWADARDGFAADEVDADLLQGKEIRVGAEASDLSFWRFDPADPSWRDDALLALALSPIFKNKSPVGISIAWLGEDAVREGGVTIDPCPGETYVADLKLRHVNLTLLDSQRLSVVARLIAAAVRVHGHVHDATTDEVVEICARACARKRVAVGNLPAAWGAAIRQRMDGPVQ